MKKPINKKSKNSNYSDSLITCPVCGFSFKVFDTETNKKVKKCPMCGHIFKDPNIFPQKPNDIGPRTFY